jgi:hypothetical protein
MNEKNFDFEAKKIKINGHVFEILKTDADVLLKTNEITEQYEALKEIGDLENAAGRKKVTELVQEIMAYIDEMLGKGALKKISGGKPVGIVMSVKVMNEVAKTIVEMYAADVDDEFGTDTEKADGKAAY